MISSFVAAYYVLDEAAVPDVRRHQLPTAATRGLHRPSTRRQTKRQTIALDRDIDAGSRSREPDATHNAWIRRGPRAI